MNVDADIDAARDGSHIMLMRYARVTLRDVIECLLLMMLPLHANMPCRAFALRLSLEKMPD